MGAAGNGWEKSPVGSGTALRLGLRIIPRASRDGWGGWRNGRLVVRLTAPPQDGKANARLIRFLADEFVAPPGAIHIERGATSREKTVRIDGPKRLPPVLDEAPEGSLTSLAADGRQS